MELTLSKQSKVFFVILNSFFKRIEIVNRILIVSFLLSFHLYLVDYFIKDVVITVLLSLILSCILIQNRP